MGLPCARYELASFQDRAAVLSPSFLERGDRKFDVLVTGNLLLAAWIKGYSTTKRYRIKAYTLERVLRAVKICPNLPLDWSPGKEFSDPYDVFVGYLLLDAWIGNTDRHHENWGFVARAAPGATASVHLAPTLDHASSLGRNEPDEKRRRRLSGRDRRFTISAYCERTRSAFYRPGKDSRTLGTFEAFESAARGRSDCAHAWGRRLRPINADAVAKIIMRISVDRMSPAARDFASQMLEWNRTRLLELINEI